jgi:hypothetical protein
MADKLRPEYDLKSLPVRGFGPGRKNFGGSVIRLEPDVAEAFPTADAVNEALGFLVRITKKVNRLPVGRAAHRNITQGLTSACMRF